MHNHHIALALADARVAELQRAATHRTATMPPRPHHRHLRALALLAVAALAALAALAPTGALARPESGTTARQDLRSPDTRDAAQTAERQDLRSPDTRDAAEGRGTQDSPDVVLVKVPQPAPQPSPAGGIDWADAGIGAGSLLGLSLIGLGGALVAVRRRRATHGTPPVVGL